MQALADENETVLDFTESKAIERIKDGDGAMIRFILATKGRKRGYGDKVEVINETPQRIEIKLIDELGEDE